MARRDAVDRRSVRDLRPNQRLALSPTVSNGDREVLRKALVLAREFAEWPAGIDRLASVLKAIDAALELVAEPAAKAP